MSRSRKKNPIIKYAPKDASDNKRFANKRIRRTEDVPNGKAYKKIYNPWDIHDCVSRWTWQECVDRFYRNRIWYITYFGWTPEECHEKHWTSFNEWAKDFLRK